MSNLFGGNLEQMDSLGRQFQTQAEAVVSLRNSINGTLEGTGWTGPFSEKFRSDWHGVFVPALTKLEQSLREASSVVNDRRQAIDVATR
jgi:hypothetical protein